MILYYTTSAGYDQVQNKVINSLGGFKSSTPVVNDDFNNIFGEITPLTINKNQNEYIAIILKNETGGDVSNAEIWITTPEKTYSNIELAIVTTAINTEGNPYMERVRDIHNRPFNATFYSSDVDNKLLIGDITDGQELGIWIKRSLNLTNIQTDDENRYIKDPTNSNVYIDAELEQEDTIQLNISYS